MSIEQHASWEDIVAGEPTACAVCGTDLEPGMDTIIRFPDQPGEIFCDRCSHMVELGLFASRPAPLDTTDKHLRAHVAVLAALIGISAAAIVAILALYSR